tara:strand:+ start:22139 stop:22504 length:366 start_codon:yes stop_codon:yes gene_type:complete
MSKVKVGDLVCLYRRKKEGLGLVLKKEADLASMGGFEPELLYRPPPASKHINWWYAIEEAIRDAIDPKAAQAYVSYNHYGKKKNLKKKFVYVKWIKKPSDYHAEKMHEDEQWIPVDWVKSV